MSAETAFGLSRYVENSRREELVEFLRQAWESQAGQLPESLGDDLELLRRWFRPDLSGSAARQALQVLPRSKPPPDDLTESVFLRLPGNRGLVTPEGRLLLDLLGDSAQTIDDRALLRAHATLSEFYGSTYRERLKSVLEGGDVRLHTFAFVLLLMLNGSIGEEMAFRVPDELDAEASLATAVASILDAFVTATGGRELSEKQRERLRSNWALTEAAAQLPRFVSHSKGRYWLRPEDFGELPEGLAVVLGTRRDPPSVESVSAGLDAAYDAYKERRPSFAALDLAHDDPNRARAGLRRISSAYRTYLRS